jgi:WD40 repeat protein
MAWRPGEKVLASCGLDGQVRLWSTDSDTPVHSSAGPDRWLSKLGWQRKGTVLAVAGGRQVGFYDHQGKSLSISQPHQSSLVDLSWLPHEDLCITAGYLGLQAWRVGQSEPVRLYRWQGSTVCLAVSPNQRYIATGDQDCTVHFWRTKKPSQDESAMMSGYATKVQQLSWRSDSRKLATGGSCDVCLWDCLDPGPEDRPPRLLKGNPQAFISALAYQPKGPLLASGNEAGELCLWLPDRQSHPVQSVCLGAEVSVLAWSPCGQRLACGTGDGQLTLYSVAA